MMAQLLFLSTVFLPLIGGLVLLLFLRGEDQHRQIIFSSVIVALSLLSTMFTIMMHPPPSTVCISWLASAGSMCVTFERSTLILIFLSSLPLLLIFIAGKNTISSAVEFGLLLIAFSMMQVALVSEHFMLRYVALEFVGLCITAAALLLTFANENRWNNTKQVFINLRIGDLALLVAIFLMFNLSNSFDISRNFTDALVGASDIQVILSACLLIAVWVKMAIWPLNQWRNATKSVTRSIRTWLFDMCAPMLGAYLLYRSVPLLEIQQRTLFPLILVTAYFAVISFVVRGARRDHLQHIQRSAFQWTSISLVLAGFWIGQEGVWTYMFLWLFLRVAYLVWLEIYSRTESAAAQRIHIEVIHGVLTGGISFLLLWRISAQTDVPLIASVTLWAMWCTHLISNAKNLAQQFQSLGNDGSTIMQPKRIFTVFLAGIAILVTGIVLAGHAARIVKGGGYTLWAETMQLPLLPFLHQNFWIGLLVGDLVLLISRQLVRLKAVFARVQQRFSPVGLKSEKMTEIRSSDPLDFYEKAKQVFQNLAEFIYQRFEKEGAEKMVEGLNGVFKFLFQTVEGFTSGNLWNRTLEAVLRSSRNLQQMHHGILRFNMVLLLAFFIGISVFVWIWYANGWV